MNSINSNFDLPNQPEYFKNFWDYARGREDSDAFLEAGKKPSGSYVLPTSSATKYDEALKQESLFRTIGTYVYSHKGPSKLLGKHTTDAAAWVPDGEAIPIYDGINDFTEFAMEDHKLAAIMRMDASFLQDNPHVFGDYFIKRMARCFGSAESDGFINGTGVDMPTGILSENGAAVGVTASGITFDDVIRLYFSVDKQFRQRGAWLMNDDTALAIRLLKDKDGNPVPSDTREVFASVSGAGEFRAIANGDPCSLELFHLPHMHLFAGKLTVIVRSRADAEGSICLKVNAKGVKSAELEL